MIYLTHSPCTFSVNQGKNAVCFIVYSYSRFCLLLFRPWKNSQNFNTSCPWTAAGLAGLNLALAKNIMSPNAPKKKSILPCARFTPLVCFTLYGVFFGACFPLVAWAFEFWRHSLALTTDNFWLIHAQTPMLYMIDTAPIFLGYFAFLAGRYKVSTENYSDKLQQMVLNLEQLVEERTETLKATNQQLEKTIQQTIALAEGKVHFLANMSHEIRTPLNAIIGMATIANKRLTAPVEEDKARTSIKQILTSSHYLLQLINNILDLSKVEAGEFVLGSEVFSVEQMMKDCAQLVLSRCEEKEIHFSIDRISCSNLYVRSDKLRLMQVLVNLIGNAIKFTPEQGFIRLEAKCSEQANGQAQVDFAVDDSGIGIDAQGRETLFEPFKQAKNDTVYNAGGTGLGLAISQKIVNLLGGNIAVTSELGKGSTFFFTLNLEIAENPVHSPEQVGCCDISLQGKRILLVDDIDINRLIVCELLEDTGVFIETATDGQKAVDTFVNSPKGHFDLVFMDVQMPYMDGYAATRTIRTSEHPDAITIPIIAMTANAMQEDAQEARDNGMNDYLAKPVDPEKMIAVLRDYIGT